VIAYQSGLVSPTTSCSSRAIRNRWVQVGVAGHVIESQPEQAPQALDAINTLPV
jgi:hypothetical protein